jgi:hypothetical protein
MEKKGVKHILFITASIIFLLSITFFISAASISTPQNPSISGYLTGRVSSEISIPEKPSLSESESGTILKSEAGIDSQSEINELDNMISQRKISICGTCGDGFALCTEEICNSLGEECAFSPKFLFGGSCVNIFES